MIFIKFIYKDFPEHHRSSLALDTKFMINFIHRERQKENIQRINI